MEQNNQRFKNVDNRFPLQADVMANKDGSLSITWTVDNKYDFEPYPSDFFTDLPVSRERNQVLKLDDGLSNYLVKIGIAKEFQYRAQWQEIIFIPKP